MNCTTRYAIYQRGSNDLQEQFDINYKYAHFQYHASDSAMSYHAQGQFEMVDSTLHMEFPANAELESLSPFKKAYNELLKTGESDSIEINVVNFDVRTKNKLKPGRHVKHSIEMVAAKDSSIVHKVAYPAFSIEATGEDVLVRSKVSGYFDQYAVLPRNGEYSLHFYMQPSQTLISFETTNVECYEVILGPSLQLKADNANGKGIQQLTIVGESYIPYDRKSAPFILVGIEKKKLKILP